jgi:hypothetical protein
MIDEAFKTARQVFSSSRKISTWSDTQPAAPRVKNEDKEELKIDMSDDNATGEFNDYDE